MRVNFKRSRLLRRPTGASGPVYAVGNADRQGSVLLVVIGLLGMLLLLGIAFYSFSTQEQASSQIYAEASKVDSGFSTEKLWSFALEQLILGTNPLDTTKRHSALFGRRHALLGGILGRTDQTAFDGFDLTPFNGTGINVQYDTAMGSVGDPYVDQNFDGAADPDAAPAGQSLLNFNYSWAANNGAQPTIPTSPAMDVDYTAPDINTLPLAFIGRGVNQLGADVSVMNPSFHRPQLLRSGGGPIGGATPNWMTNSVTAQRILRPHPNHMCVGTNGYTRFLNPAGGPYYNSLGQVVAGFPFGNSTTLKQGVWDFTGPSVAVPVYSWDMDNDGDGIKEGIWMDLDFPVQTLADGRKYVPLFSFTVTDADGLINLNVSGNQAGLVSPPAVPFVPLGNNRHISRSNQALSRAEISPEWALLANPSAGAPRTTDQLTLFWNTAASNLNRMEVANIETLFLNIGRPEFASNASGTYTIPGGGGVTYEPTKYYPGRYGELLLMGPNSYTVSGRGIAGVGDGAVANRDLSVLPAPGYSSQINPGAGDDDSDSQLGQARTDSAGYYFMGTSFASYQSNVNVPSFIHPLDFWGDGDNIYSTGNGMRMRLSASGGTPMTWPYYAYGYSSPGDATTFGYINYLNAGAGNLLPSYRDGQVDEADEIIANYEIATSNATMKQDEIFGVDNMFELHATDTDLTTTTLQARVRDLAPYNFKQVAQAADIRKQFTVISHDRRNFGMSPLIKRYWEFNADVDTDTYLEFPPQFASAAGTLPNEPFRQVLRQLLYVELNQDTAATSLAQLRLNLNRLLIGFDTTSEAIGAPIYRDLTAHPVTGLGSTPIIAPTWNADSPPVPLVTPSVNDQEYWARYDRQRMARDIYVLLYTLGGGRDDLNHAAVTNASNGLFSAAQLKEMAQFAVNVVDGLDRDNVITKFEYDMNLYDPLTPANGGWNLDDNAYTVETTTERGVVYGVEAQRLTISEVLGIRTLRGKDEGAGSYRNDLATEVNDSDGDRMWTYIELRNASPFSINLSNGEWQIAVQADDGPDGIANNGDETDISQLTLLSGNGTNVIAPGALFTIGTRGGPASLGPGASTNNLPSVLKIDATGAAAPDFTATNPDAQLVPAAGTTLDLDLIPLTGTTHNTALSLLTKGTAGIPGVGSNVGTAGNFLYSDPTNIAAPGAPYTFVLRRRLHPTRAIPSALSDVAQFNDNPFVEVDRFILPQWVDFDLTAASNPTIATDNVPLKLQALASQERAQPFSHNLAEAPHGPGAATTYRSHSVGSNNSNSPGTFNQVQLHFDRDYASPVDLLYVPLYGPDQVTRRVGLPAMLDSGLNDANTSYLAQERFLRPHHFDNNASWYASGTAAPGVSASAATATTDIKNNRWYRILEMLEVPTQTEQGMRVYPYAVRSSGAVNLNTVRTRGVLAGILDDADDPTSAGAVEGHFNPLYGSESAMLNDQFEGGRDWWLQFLKSRDGIDPLTGLILPGTPQVFGQVIGRPFRSLTYSENSSNSLEDTVLRSLPSDILTATTAASYSDRRTLFEARTNSDRKSVSGASSDVIDPATRHRLLRKVVNNTTTRSNVFIVWITTKNFEAIQQTSGEVQIGAELSGSTDHRGFFIIDRSLPETAYNSNYGLFDYRKFIQYRKTLH